MSNIEGFRQILSDFGRETGNRTCIHSNRQHYDPCQDQASDRVSSGFVTRGWVGDAMEWGCGFV